MATDKGTGGPGGMGQGASLIINKIETLNIGGQKEAEIWTFPRPASKELENGCLMTLNSRAGNQILDKFYGALEYLVLGRVFLLEHLTAQAETKDLGVACIYFNHKETEVQTLDNLLAGLWRQLILRKPLGSAAQLYEQNIEKKTRPSYEDMQKLLASALIGFMQIYIILDGVDEYPEEQWGRLAKALTNLGLVNLLVMSRPHIAPTTLFPNLVTLEIKANDGDIQSYVNRQIQMSTRLSKLIAGKPELRGEISSEICSRVEGISEHSSHIKEVHQALQELPKDLDHTYENTMNRIDAQPSGDRKIARSALTWVVNAQKPLTILELCMALAIEPGSKELDNDNMTDIGIILSVCAGLVIMEEHSSPVRLVHFTAQNYLDRIQTEKFPDAHFEITQNLLTYLQFEECMEGMYYDEDNGVALFQYCQYCLVHAQWCEEQLKDEIVRFLGETCKYHSQQYRNKWHSPPWNCYIWPGSPSPLWVAASANLVKTTSHLLELAPKSPDSQELTVAAYCGHQKICKLLLNKGADVNAQGGQCGNALQAAASRGHDKIVQVLLNKGADVNAQGGFYGNALQAAASEGHDKIFQVLLDKGADVNAQGGFYGNALQAAASEGHDKIVQVLFSRGADVNAQGGEYGNVLQAAAFGGHDKIVQVLLDKGADVNAQGGFHGNALQAAASGGHDKIFQVLLDKGADTNAQGGDHGNALQAAAYGGHDKIVQVLLDKGADTNAQGGDHGNALQAAAYGGHDKIVQVLLDKGSSLWRP
ncbi:ankyrin repeat-containing domain protein [Mycena olivaceomarginata]|nr:ankyrin repeat-containing domain protein [Mycena olivaceomarginata]